MLLDVPELGAGGCVLVLPLVHGSFRSSIFPGEDDGVVVCAESGLTAVTATDFRRIAYVNVGHDPYTVMQEAYLAARVHLGTFRLVQNFRSSIVKLPCGLHMTVSASSICTL